MRRRLTLGLLFLSWSWLASVNTRATTFLTLQSTYLGDGWFQYQINMPNDPFYKNACVFSLTLDFTNLIDHVDGPDGWTFDGTNGWAYTNGFPAWPYTETFFMRSSNTCWRLATNPPAFMPFSATFSDYNPAKNAHISSVGGYIAPPYLTPCSPAEADGSPTNYVFVLKMLPDILINQLIQTNGNIYGVDFTWDYDSTFSLEGSSDLKHWTNITYLWSYPPETVWTTNSPLNDYGQFFRVELVAKGHSTNVPPLASALVLKSNAKAGFSPLPEVTSCQMSKGKVLVGIATRSGQTVQVQAVDSHGSILQTQQFTSSGTSATTTFEAASLPNPVFFNATAAK